MGKPYSSDLRHRFVAVLDEGMGACAAGRRMRVSKSTAIRWASIWQRERRAQALPMGGDRRSAALEAHAGSILSWLQDQPDLFMSEIVARLAREEGIERSQSAVIRLLERHSVTRKKRPSLPQNRHERTSPKRASSGARR